MIPRRLLLLLLCASCSYGADPDKRADFVTYYTGQATALDPTTFAIAKKTEDCRRCTSCGITSDRCARACEPRDTSDVVIPDTCHPLYHDGQVCLDALIAASCGDYATYVDDVAPATPSECDFCQLPPADGGGS